MQTIDQLVCIGDTIILQKLFVIEVWPQREALVTAIPFVSVIIVIPVQFVWIYTIYYYGQFGGITVDIIGFLGT